MELDIVDWIKRVDNFCWRSGRFSKQVLQMSSFQYLTNDLSAGILTVVGDIGLTPFATE